VPPFVETPSTRKPGQTKVHWTNRDRGVPRWMGIRTQKGSRIQSTTMRLIIIGSENHVWKKNRDRSANQPEGTWFFREKRAR